MRPVSSVMMILGVRPSCNGPVLRAVTGVRTRRAGVVKLARSGIEMMFLSFRSLGAGGIVSRDGAVLCGVCGMFSAAAYPMPAGILRWIQFLEKNLDDVGPAHGSKKAQTLSNIPAAMPHLHLGVDMLEPRNCAW